MTHDFEWQVKHDLDLLRQAVTDLFAADRQLLTASPTLLNQQTGLIFGLCRLLEMDIGRVAFQIAGAVPDAIIRKPMTGAGSSVSETEAEVREQNLESKKESA